MNKVLYKLAKNDDETLNKGPSFGVFSVHLLSHEGFFLLPRVVLETGKAEIGKLVEIFAFEKKTSIERIKENDLSVDDMDIGIIAGPFYMRAETFVVNQIYGKLDNLEAKNFREVKDYLASLTKL